MVVLLGRRAGRSTFIPKLRIALASIPFLVAALGYATAARATSSGAAVKQILGGYGDNQGRSRQRLGYDLNSGAMGGASLPLTLNADLLLTRDQYSHTQMRDASYEREVYGAGGKVNDSAALTLAETVAKQTEIRQLASFATDHFSTIKSWGLGLSRWLRSDTIRAGVDVTRTEIDQPPYEVLDVDFQTVANPPIATSTAATLSLRHLATPTTIIDYNATHVATANRPDTQVAALALRQYLPPWRGAVHTAVTRALNRGTITTATTYGQVDAWIIEAAYLQHLGAQTRGRLGWRYYREDERQRAYGDRSTLGTDLFTAGLANEWRWAGNGGQGTAPTTLQIELSAGRYLTNIGLAANIVELSLGGKI